MGVKIDIVAAHRPWVRRTKANLRCRPEGQLSLDVTTRHSNARRLRSAVTNSAETIHPRNLLRRRQVLRKPGKEEGARTPAHCGFYDTAPRPEREGLFLDVIFFPE